MKQHARLSPLRSIASPCSIATCLIVTAVLGCARDEVSLGSGQEVEGVAPSDLCGDGIVEGTVVLTSQADVERLRGCTEITGDMQLGGFPDMDLTPLSALRIVRGDLLVGSGGSLGEQVTTVSSLAGLEGLEQVNGLTLTNLTVPDLSGLAGLRRVSFDPLGLRAAGGNVYISTCNELRDLSGLDSLVDFDALELYNNAQLESLEGLRVPPALSTVSIGANPSLRTLSALRPLRDVGELQLQETGIENLDGLRLRSVESLTLVSNPSLTEVSSLKSLSSLRSFYVQGNPRLLELPSLASIGDIEIVSVVDNAELVSVPVSLGNTATGIHVPAEGFSEGVVYFGFDFIEVANNPKLARLSINGSFPQGRVVAIHGNAGLTEIDLGVLNELQGLHIVDNASLATVRLAQPARAVELQIRNNPLLSTAPFAGVQSLSSTISGNLD